MCQSAELHSIISHRRQTPSLWLTFRICYCFLLKTPFLSDDLCSLFLENHPCQVHIFRQSRDGNSLALSHVVALKSSLTVTANKITKLNKINVYVHVLNAEKLNLLMPVHTERLWNSMFYNRIITFRWGAAVLWRRSVFFMLLSRRSSKKVKNRGQTSKLPHVFGGPSFSLSGQA